MRSILRALRAFAVERRNPTMARRAVWRAVRRHFPGNRTRIASVNDHKTPERSAGLRVARGLAFALLFGVIGAATPVIVLVGSILLGSSESDWAFDLHFLPDRLVFPVIGTALVMASTAWATYAPAGSYRFARTLVIVFAVSVPSWYLLAATGLSPPRLKAASHPLIYPFEVLLLVVPPIAVACVLSWRRCRKNASLPVDSG